MNSPGRIALVLITVSGLLDPACFVNGRSAKNAERSTATSLPDQALATPVLMAEKPLFSNVVSWHVKRELGTYHKGYFVGNHVSEEDKNDFQDTALQRNGDMATTHQRIVDPLEALCDQFLNNFAVKFENLLYAEMIPRTIVMTLESAIDNALPEFLFSYADVRSSHWYILGSRNVLAVDLMIYLRDLEKSLAYENLVIEYIVLAFLEDLLPSDRAIALTNQLFNRAPAMSDGSTLFTRLLDQFVEKMLANPNQVLADVAPTPLPRLIQSVRPAETDDEGHLFTRLTSDVESITRMPLNHAVAAVLENDPYIAEAVDTMILGSRLPISQNRSAWIRTLAGDRPDILLEAVKQRGLTFYFSRASSPSTALFLDKATAVEKLLEGTVKHGQVRLGYSINSIVPRADFAAFLLRHAA